jgi:hypothetical protein
MNIGVRLDLIPSCMAGGRWMDVEKRKATGLTASAHITAFIFVERALTCAGRTDADKSGHTMSPNRRRPAATARRPARSNRSRAGWPTRTTAARRENDALQGCHWTVSLLKRWLATTTALTGRVDRRRQQVLRGERQRSQSGACGMNTFKHGLVMAARDHLLEGKPITLLEAIVLFGVPALTKLISDMRKQGWTVHSQKIPFAAAARRVNEYAVLQSPKNLPIKEIQLAEYWVSK